MLHLLLSPLTWGVLLACALGFAQHRGVRVVAWIGIVTCAFLAAPLGANALVWLIEQRLPAGPACASDDRSPVLILTGGFDHTPRDASDFAMLSSASLRRLAVGLAVAAQAPAVPVIISGGAATGRAEADVAAALAVRLGLAPARLVVEPRAMNTWENAQQVVKLLAGPGRRVQLVTSALHAPRATLALRANGIDSCRHVADSIYTPMTGAGYFVPQSSSLVKTERAIHELVGLLSYWLKAGPPLH